MHDSPTWSQVVRFWTRELAQLMPQGEAAAIARLVASRLSGLHTASVSFSQDHILPDILAAGDQIIRRAAHGEPIQYIMEQAWFMDIELRVTPAVLIPRPETEELVQLVLTDAPRNARILDIGTGSGCIAIAIKQRRPDLKVFATDISPAALEIARFNSDSQGTDIYFFQTDILLDLPNPAGSTFDLLVSNPPYIAPEEADLMEETVLRHEPSLALFAPEGDPLAFYRSILHLGPSWKHADTLLYFEINPLFAPALVMTSREAGYDDVKIHIDLSGKQRFLFARRG